MRLWKKLRIFIEILLILGVLLFFFLQEERKACRHLSAEDFLQKAQQIEQMSSTNWATYIGISQHYVYLEFGTALTWNSQPKTTIYWTEIQNLPQRIQRQLYAGESPWEPWRPVKSRSDVER
jgi:hypothetical protein